MIFTKEDYVKREIKEIKELHREFTSTIKKAVGLLEKIREYQPCGDYDFRSVLPMQESLYTPFEDHSRYLTAMSNDELIFTSLDDYDKNYRHGDKGELDMFYDREVLDARSEILVE